MLAYVALVWNFLDPATNAAAGDLVARLERAVPYWVTTASCGSLHIRHHIERGPNIDEAYLLTRERGVVFGKLFTRRYVDVGDSSSSAPSAVVLDDRVSDQIVGSSGRHLISAYWGQYVAFIARPEAQESWILRDPSGGVPCHWMQVQGVSVYFVRMADCDALGPFSYTIICINCEDFSSVIARACARQGLSR